MSRAGAATQDGTAPALTLETVADLEPFSPEVGPEEPQTVPHALYAMLFGQPDAADGGAVAPLHTYAVLDAAKVSGLPEMLETSGLEHACLFQGDAADTLRDVAPWIVRLEDGARLTRCLFTKGDAPWQMWDNEPGIFLRSTETLQNVRRHLRKFTNVQDEDSTSYYFRFWEPGLAAWYFESILSDAERVGQLLCLRPGAFVEVVTLDPDTAEAKRFRPIDPRRPNRPFRLEARDRTAFRRYRWVRFLTRLSDHLETHDSRLSRLPRQERLGHADALVQRAYAVGLSAERAVADYATALLLSDGRAESDAICQKILSNDDHPLDKASAVLREVTQRLRHRT